MSSFLKKVESNIAKHDASTDGNNTNSRLPNGAFLKTSTTGMIAVDPTVPPLRLPLPPASNTSRFFPNNPSQRPMILVENSSPDRPPSSQSSYTPHQTHFAQSTYGPSSYVPQRVGLFQDPFAPSTLSRPNGKSRPAPDSASEPPRKKQNLGRSSGAVILVEDTPESSPDASFRYSTNRNVIMSPLDELDSPGPGRIRRGRPDNNGIPPLGPLPQLSPLANRSSSVQAPTMTFTTLMNSFPNLSEKEVHYALDITGGNYGHAAGILSELDNSKDRNYSISIAAQQEQERLAKELAKQRKNKSAIYANRNAGAQQQLTPVRTKKKDDDSDTDEDDFKGDGFDSDASNDEDRTNDSELEALCTIEALEYFNSADAEGLVMMIACTPEQADAIIKMRPFMSVDDVERKMVRRSGVTSKLFENYKDLMKGYKAVDAVLQRCERIGQDIDDVQNIWQRNADKRPIKLKKEVGMYLVDDPSESTSDIPPEDMKIMDQYIWDAPESLAKDVTLKSYQIIGLNWLNLLYNRGHSCILADEMGLGKTIQVIAFLTYLKDMGARDKYLIIVPASTLENWIREFGRFSPGMQVVSYYGTINERAGLRREFLETLDNWDVMITTYNFAQGGGNDSKFFKKVTWSICVFDEGHVLKNYQSQRYHALMKIRAKWRLLLTGTPLQNNLQELLSLMNFILPKIFTDVVESFRAIFKVKASAQAGMLAHERVSRAKRMMTPFVLRRRKDQVLKELPKKTERIEWCDMTPLQSEIYHQALQRSRRVLMEESEEEDELAIAEAAGQKGRPKKKKQIKAQQQDLSSNVLMDLRKATAHPMLFRRLYDDETVKVIAKACLQEPEFQESKLPLVIEDMSVMTDAEIHHFCKRYKSVRKHALDESRHLEAGKVSVLLKLLEEYIKEGRRVLIFSQFTQILDILKTVLDHIGYRYLVLTGSTAVDERQGLVDEFNGDETCKVFLLSTKAGGMGINLTAASVVITFDQDFNPHNDLQASDRAYRIGQQRDVDVIKLITKGTIEEDILQLANTKLQLDEAVAGDEEASKQTENEVKKSLIQRLRKQLEQSDTANGKISPAPAEVKTEDIAPPTQSTDIADLPYAGDMLSALPAALLAVARSGSGSSSPAGSLLRAEETPPATQSPTPLPTPPENLRDHRTDIIMVDD